MTINDPAVLEAVRAAFDLYEAALLRNDTEALDRFFIADVGVVRYGVADMQYGIEAIRSFRATQRPFERRLDQTLITAFGSDVAVASTLFYREDAPGAMGRQQQTWVRTADGWRIGAAHVSMVPAT
jgi:ketosteroid isomerase-like protein